ncbi:MAG: hypothetical protein E7168_05250 [Firmicutes bacterium]|nr:hypothetical protein [Bacillota bacterium]
MLKKYFSYLGVFVLVCFSFFYTEKAAEIVRMNDPIMKVILQNSSYYEIEPVNAIITGDEIIPGLNGRTVNVNESYSNMKKINRYQESLLVFDEVLPEIILEYDKYLVQGNDTIQQVALIFKVDSISNLKQVSKILLDKNVVATFFIDGDVIQANLDEIEGLASDGYEIENLGYQGVYSKERFMWTNNMIETLTDSKVKYCYTEYKNSSILDLCSSHKMYTIQPTIYTGNYPFLSVKKNLENGSMISFDLKSQTLKELPSVISYIKQKGYDLVTVNQLIDQSSSNDK